MIQKIKQYLSKRISSIATYVFLFSCSCVAFILVDVFTDSYFVNPDIEIKTGIFFAVLTVVSIFIFFYGKTCGYGQKHLSINRILYYVEIGFIVFIMMLTFSLAEKIGVNQIDVYIGFGVLTLLFVDVILSKRGKLDYDRREMLSFKTFDNSRFYFMVLEADGNKLKGRKIGSLILEENVYIYNCDSYVGKAIITDINNEEELSVIEIETEKEYKFEKFDVISTVVPPEYINANPEESFFPIENVYLHTLISYYRDYVTDLDYMKKFVKSLSDARLIRVDMIVDKNKYEELILNDGDDNRYYPLFTCYEELRKNDELDIYKYKTRLLDAHDIYRQVNNKMFVIDPFSSAIRTSPALIHASVSLKESNVRRSDRICKDIVDYHSGNYNNYLDNEIDLSEMIQKEINELERKELRSYIKEDRKPRDLDRVSYLLHKHYPLNNLEYDFIKRSINHIGTKDERERLFAYIKQKQTYKRMNKWMILGIFIFFLMISLLTTFYDRSLSVSVSLISIISFIIIVLFNKNRTWLSATVTLTFSCVFLFGALSMSNVDSVLRIGESVMTVAAILYMVLVMYFVFTVRKNKKYKDSAVITDIDSNPRI